MSHHLPSASPRHAHTIFGRIDPSCISRPKDQSIATKDYTQPTRHMTTKRTDTARSSYTVYCTAGTQTLTPHRRSGHASKPLPHSSHRPASPTLLSSPRLLHATFCLVPPYPLFPSSPHPARLAPFPLLSTPLLPCARKFRRARPWQSSRSRSCPSRRPSTSRRWPSRPMAPGRG